MKLFTKTYLWLLALPYALVFLGAVSNQAVIIANHGKFPVMVNEFRPGVSPEGMLDGQHCVMTDKTRLNALADVFDFHAEIESIGDLAIDLGDFLRPFSFASWLTLAVRKLYSC